MPAKSSVPRDLRRLAALSWNGSFRRNLAVRSGIAKCRLITPSRSFPAVVAKASVRGRRCHLPEDVPVRSEARCFRASLVRPVRDRTRLEAKMLEVPRNQIRTFRHTDATVLVLERSVPRPEDPKPSAPVTGPDHPGASARPVPPGVPISRSGRPTSALVLFHHKPAAARERDACPSVRIRLPPAASRLRTWGVLEQRFCRGFRLEVPPADIFHRSGTTVDARHRRSPEQWR